MSESSIEELGEVTAVHCRFVQRTDVGKRRSENQDTHGYLRTNRGTLFLVADGMGGAQGGATASALAIDVLTTDSVDDSVVTERSLRDAIRKANRTIFDFAKTSDKLSGMGTTLVALSLFPDAFYVAHVGDSRIYRLRDKTLEPLTKDHTLVQELLDSGTLEPDQAENHPISHMLTRSLGPMPTVDAEVNRLDYPTQEGDIFLLCCDGLINHVNDDEIEKVLANNSMDDAADMLVELALQRGGSDNITVQLVSVEPGPVSDSDVLGVGEVERYSSSDLKFDDLEDAVAGEAESSNSAEGSAVDSIIFGEAPSSEEINRKQKEAAAKAAENAAASAAAREEVVYSDEEDDDEDEDEEEFEEEVEQVSESDFRSLHKLQMFGIGVIFSALVALLVVLMPRLFGSGGAPSAPELPQQAGAVGETSQVASPVTAALNDGAELVPEPIELPSDIPFESDPNPAESSMETTGAESAGEVAWPVADVVPAKPEEDPSLESGETGTVETEAKPSESVPTGPVKVSTKLKIGELDFSISKEEVATVIKRKEEISKNLQEVILRRQLLGLTTADQLLGKQREVESELAENQRLLEEVSVAISDLVAAYTGWQKKEGAVNSDDVAELAKELSAFDPAVGEAMDRFSKASLSYGHVLEGDFKGTPEEKHNLTSVFTNSRRTLAEAVFVGIQNRLEVLRNELRTALGTRYNLRRKEVELQNMSKVFPTYRAPLNLERFAREHSLEKEQSTLSAELRAHRLKVSDEQQRALHVETELHELGLN